MPVANDSVAVTPGTGATIATHLAASREHQVVMLAVPSGQLHGDAATFVAATQNTIHVAAARTLLFDLFNATGSGVILRVRGIYVIPALVAVTGVGMTYEVLRTTAVGTGGTAITPAPFDTATPALPAQVTARTKAAGGATSGTLLHTINGSSEETSPYAGLASILNHLPGAGLPVPQPIVLREGEGLRVDQTTNSAVGNVNVVVLFTVE
jgi:hypothetical protein